MYNPYMRNETFTKLRLLYVLAVLATTVLALAFIRINLSQTGSEAIRQFSMSNRTELATANTMSLATKLNALLASENIQCVSGKYKSLDFVNVAKGSCSSSLLVSESVYHPPGVEDLEIHISFVVPHFLIYSALSFILGEIILFLILLKINHQKILLDEKMKELVVNLSKQVAHDIRSPLAALKVAVDDPDLISHDKLFLVHSSIERIDDIANNLLNSSHRNENFSLLKNEMLAPIINSLVSEKRLQYSHSKNIDIDLDLTQSYGLFARINATELKRVLSNLINNSVEAIEENGIITVQVKENSSGQIQITVSDNGKGVPEHILSKLGEKGFSYGKKSGNGLGLSHAKEVVESLNGQLKVTSVVNKGTVIDISLPKQDAPALFPESLVINPEDKIFVLDDEESIHHAWRQKLPFTVEVFANAEDFIKAVKNAGSSFFLALVDYELKNQSKTGLDVIKELKIEKQSLLVTSRFEEKPLVKECERLHLKILPKMLISSIPVRTQQTAYDYVLIDDEKLVRLSWEKRAEGQNIKLLTLKSSKDFDQHSKNINKEETRIYIDSHLGENEVRGEDFAASLNQLGYKNLFLASGFAKEDFETNEWLKYSGKNCPF